MGRQPKPKPWSNYDNLHELYEVQELSTGAIAQKYDVFPNTVRRELIKHGIKLRKRNDAQKKYLENHEHPMKGRQRSEEERESISMGVQKKWEELSPKEIKERKEELSKRAKKKWQDMSEEEKTQNINKMHKANRAQSGMGSKNENLVADMLKEAGYKLVQRTTDYTPNRQFEIDIAIPSESIAIEWDGAAHFRPIYGEEALERTQEKDARKDKALLSNSWTVIRCRDHSTAHSLAFCRRAVDKIIKVINNKSKGKVYYLDME